MCPPSLLLPIYFAMQNQYAISQTIPSRDHLLPIHFLSLAFVSLLLIFLQNGSYVSRQVCHHEFLEVSAIYSACRRQLYMLFAMRFFLQKSMVKIYQNCLKRLVKDFLIKFMNCFTHEIYSDGWKFRDSCPIQSCFENIEIILDVCYATLILSFSRG